MSGEPQTEAGRSLDAQFGVGQFGRVRDLILAIEAEAREAERARIREAVEALPALVPDHGHADMDPPYLVRADVLRALTRSA